VTGYLQAASRWETKETDLLFLWSRDAAKIVMENEAALVGWIRSGLP
jgi:hypothetical protein